jgi:hypothetical protein
MGGGHFWVDKFVFRVCSVIHVPMVTQYLEAKALYAGYQLVALNGFLHSFTGYQYRLLYTINSFPLKEKQMYQMKRIINEYNNFR